MYVGACSLWDRERSFVAPSVWFAVRRGSACSGDARSCVWESSRVHRVHSVMALRDYVIAFVSRWFALVVVLRASEMHGMRVGEFACIGDASAWSAWLDVEYMRTVAYDYARFRVRGGGGGEEGSSAWWQVVQSSARASRFARVPLQRRYGGSGAYAPMKRLSCVVS